MCILYLLQRGRRLLEQRNSSMTEPLYQYERTAGAGRVKMIWTTDIKLKGSDHKTFANTKIESLSVQPCACLYVSSCVQSESLEKLEETGEEALLWKLSQHQHMVSHWRDHHNSLIFAGAPFLGPAPQLCQADLSDQVALTNNSIFTRLPGKLKHPKWRNTADYLGT